jgi:predicted cupin superfamily sugar epimerase
MSADRRYPERKEDSVTRCQPETARLLALIPHPEGGWYRETWRSDIMVHPSGYPSDRPTCTVIYFLLEPGDKSQWHTVRSPELWLWHRGGPLELFLGGQGTEPADQPQSITLGPDVSQGQQLQALVPGHCWQSAQPVEDREVLVSCVVSPGFVFDDFYMPGQAK